MDFGKLFHGGITVLLGGGMSLRGFSVKQLQRSDLKVMAVKGSMFDAPFARAGFGVDMPRYEEWRERIRRELTMPVFWAVPDPTGRGLLEHRPLNVHFLQRISKVGWSTDWRTNYAGGSSGFGALGAVAAMGAKLVLTLGYDYSGDGRAPHHNPQHYVMKRMHDDSQWRLWAEAFTVIKPRLDHAGVKVVNVTMGKRSLLSAFTSVVSLEDGLRHLGA